MGIRKRAFEFADAILSLIRADDGEQKLPCDVKLTPGPLIRKGCKVSTLMEAIGHQRSFAENPITEEQRQQMRDALNALAPEPPHD
jgi:hypothetical protein